MARSGRDHTPDDDRQPGPPTFQGDSLRDHMADQRGPSRASTPSQNWLSTKAATRAGLASRRRPYPDPDRDRHYSLRDSEVGTLVEIATFRAVTLDDLAQFRYAGDKAQARRDLETLDRQGLIRRRTTYP